MEWKRWFGGYRQPEIEIGLTQIVFPFYTPDVQSLDTAAHAVSIQASLQRLGRSLGEYAQLATLFTKLYYQNRKIAAQNFLLSCKLQAWSLVFLSYKVQIFFTRLAYGTPVNQCWPKG